MDGRGSAARFSERYPLLITERCCHTHFYDEFWLKITHFLLFFANFWITPHLFMENLLKKGPLFREFGAQKPTHMGGTYPYPKHVMYPSGVNIVLMRCGVNVTRCGVNVTDSQVVNAHCLESCWVYQHGFKSHH